MRLDSGSLTALPDHSSLTSSFIDAHRQGNIRRHGDIMVRPLKRTQQMGGTHSHPRTTITTVMSFALSLFVRTMLSHSPPFIHPTATPNGSWKQKAVCDGFHLTLIAAVVFPVFPPAQQLCLSASRLLWTKKPLPSPAP